ncbi:MAG: SPOR domain-containing protein, partial [Marinilabiliales bacterium]|nr:SPOR domain-containing protein [Marinilabiliales bacterium]
KKNVVFTVGNFGRAEDAGKMKEQLIREGMKEATVVAYQKGTNLPYTPGLVVQPAKKEAVAVPQPTEGTAPNPVANVSVEGLIFKIQIGSFKNNQQSAAFRKLHAHLKKIMTIEQYKDSKNITIYTAGACSTYPEATQLKEKLVKEGAKDCYIAAFLNGERIKMSEALKLLNTK